MENFVGKILGNRYKVRNEIGSGGMAVVYKAFDTIEQRDVAIILKENIWQAMNTESVFVMNLVL